MISIKQFFWIAPFVSFIGGYFFISYYVADTTVKVPHLIGRPLNTAVSLLSCQMLSARIIAEKEDDQVPPGTILQQKPEPYTLIRPAQPVMLVVSTIVKPLTTPQILGLNLDEQMPMIKEKGFHIQSYDVPSELPQGICIAQGPSAGTEIKAQETILVYRATPKKSLYVMPNLCGKSCQKVQEFCDTYGIDCQVIHSQETDIWHRCYTCKVQDQRPFAGTLLPLGQDKKMVIQIQV